MIRSTALATAAAFAALTAVNAFAADPLPTETHRVLTWELAVEAAQAAIASCKQQGYNVSANVVGRTGQVLVAMRGDNTGPHTLENSMKKAYTANAQRRPSGEYAKAVQANPRGGVLLTNLVPAQGALPITVDGDTIGAIGVSGSPGGDKDEACAKAGIDKVAADLQ